MEQRLRELRRLCGLMQSRKRAMDMRLGLFNARLAALLTEYDDLLKLCNGREIVPGANKHYWYRMRSINEQITSLKREISQLALLAMKAGADLRRAEVIEQRERDQVSRFREQRYLEQVIDTSLAMHG